MTKIIGAPTLDDALAALGGEVVSGERRGVKTLVFCEDRLTLLAERAVLEAAGGGTMLTEVTTFKRFLASDLRVLSKQGSVIETESLLSECAADLKCFRKGAGEAVYETIAQLSASRVGAEELLRGAEETDGILKSKLQDLALLVTKYNQFLEERGLVDENGYLALLPDALARSVGDTRVIFFAFSSFTRQGAEAVRAAALHAPEVTGIFLAGREDVYTNESARVFRSATEDAGEVQRVMLRSTLEGEAELLRRGIFCPEQYAGEKRRAEHIRIFSATDEADELNTVAALVKKYIDEGKRYRDVAVLVPDDSYFLIAEKAFTAHGIPFFADRKRPFSEHPFCALVIAALNAANDGVLPDEADDIASSVYFGKGDSYRNYLLKFGSFRGGVRREIKDGDAVQGYDRDELVLCRERMLKILSFFPRKGTGAAYCAAVRALYDFTNADAVTETLQKSLEGIPNAGTEREFLDLSRLEGVLIETEYVAGGRTFTAREFAAVLTSGLEALKISMIPQYADALFVGDATESRLTRAEVLFCTGLTDALPRVAADTAIITDREIEKLSRLRVEIEPAIKEVNARAREMLALNLCAFTEELYLSCPARKGGEETSPGEALSYVNRMFFGAPMSGLFPYNCCERGPAALALASLREDFSTARTDSGAAFQSLREALLRAGDGELVRGILDGGKKEPSSSAGELWFRGDVSPTLLESYFACPYAGFVTRGLRLREREERTVQETDAGTFVHAVLEHTAQKFNEISSEEECRKIAKEEGERLLSLPKFSALADTDSGRYTAERLVEEGVAVSAAAYLQLANSSFRVKTTEEGLSLPELLLKGTADRVDAAGEYVRIIDYKTGSIDDRPTSYYTGKRLQLQLYLRAAAKEGKAAGAFYFPAAETYTSDGEPKFRMKGFFCGESEVVSLMDSSLKDGERSEYFEGGLNVRAIDRGMSEKDFSDFLDYGILVAAGAEREMRAGNIAPSPYENACEYCKCKGMCGFKGEARKESAVSCAEIARIVRREKGEV